MGALLIGGVAAAIIVSAFFAARSGSKAAPKPIAPVQPDQPPGAPVTATCPTCGRTWTHASGIPWQIPPHPPCPFNGATNPVIPGKKTEPATPDPGPTPGILNPPKTEPDPFKPTPAPTPGYYFQTRKDYFGDPMSRDCYGGDPRPGIAWAAVYKHPANQWIAYDKKIGWTGGLVQKYSGWNTAFGSGHEYPVVFFPAREEL